jgi:hypothetical protein
MAALLNNFDLQSVGTEDGLPPRELLQLAMAPVGLRMQLRERARAPGERAPLPQPA